MTVICYQTLQNQTFPADCFIQIAFQVPGEQTGQNKEIKGIRHNNKLRYRLIATMFFNSWIENG